jgi:hypothetical protein
MPLVRSVRRAGGRFLLLNCSIAVLAGAGLSCGSDDVTAPKVAVATVSVTPPTSVLAPGSTVQLQATTQDASGATLSGREIAWSSSNNDLATVSQAGLVTGVAEGSVTITASSEGKSGTAAVAVRVPVASVLVEPDEATIAQSETVQLAATTLDAEGNALPDRPVSWSSSNAAVATVSTTGLVSGVAGGAATITATAEGQSGSAVITVSSSSGSLAGHWTLEETLGDESLGYSCENFQDITLVQDGSTFTGTNEQTGTCTRAGQEFDNSGTFQITDGRIVGDEVSFTQPGAVPCVYQGTLTLLPPSALMEGTVTCAGSVEGTPVNATGTWCAEKRETGVQGARAPRQEDKLRRIPTCA